MLLLLRRNGPWSTAPIKKTDVNANIIAAINPSGYSGTDVGEVVDDKIGGTVGNGWGTVIVPKAYTLSSSEPTYNTPLATEGKDSTAVPVW